MFEIFGYDFLIDEDFRLWLIEVNTNPYFGVPNTFIAELLPKMMDDLLALVVDPVIPPKTIPDSIILLSCLMPVCIDCKTMNDYELIYSDGTNSKSG